MNHIQLISNYYLLYNWYTALEQKIKRQHLQWEIGPRPRVKLEDFQNWATSRKTAGVFKVTPRSLEEIQAVVKAAKKLGV